MVLAWGVLAPLAVITARFFKVMPGQKWPSELDNQTWWRAHWMGQALVAVLSIFGFGLILGLRESDLSLHGWLGYTVLGFMLLQILFGIFRGSKGGPTAPSRDGSLRGDHFDMTRWRLLFEMVHKSCGYVVLGIGAVAILLGLWDANAPRWMIISLLFWWALLIAVFFVLQRRGYAIDTYQAIWGNDPGLPGNKRAAPGWGMRRLEGDINEAGGSYVRRD
jgi:hypothetical protein